MEGIQAKLVFKVIEYIILILLTIISLFLSWEAFVKYKAMETNLQHSLENVTQYPTITICFKPIKDEYIYGKDFHFNFYYNAQTFSIDKDHKLNIIQEGQNPTLGLILVKIITAYFGSCYKIVPSQNVVTKSAIIAIAIKFNEKLSQLEIPKAEIYFTSEENSRGIYRAYWYEGKPTKSQVSSNMGKSLSLFETEYNYLEAKSGCTYSQSWYDCYADLVETSNLGNCSTKCLAHSIRDGNQTMEYCKRKTPEWQCSNELLRGLRKSIIIENACPRSCNIRQYELEAVQLTFQHPKTIGFEYYFLPPYVKVVYNEYLLFDFLGLVSSVGGTLGMFIGFSIIGLVSNCFSQIIQWIERF